MSDISLPTPEDIQTAAKDQVEKALGDSIQPLEWPEQREEFNVPVPQSEI
jgi:hypothetical protein